MTQVGVEIQVCEVYYMYSFSFSLSLSPAQDGGVMVAGGKSSLLHVWDLSSQRLLQAVQLPESVRVVKQLLFLTHRYDGGTSKVHCPCT